MMKGLLLKDLYCLWGYLRVSFVLTILFIVLSCLGEENTFLLFYPCILAGMMSMSLIAYDERAKWDAYAASLPYSRAQLVSAKYLWSVFLGLFATVCSVVVQTIALLIRGIFSAMALMHLVTMILPLCLLPAAILLPFVFRFGVEKGRIVYYFTIGLFCGGWMILDRAGADTTGALATLNSGFWLLPLALVLFGLSWWLSIVFYRKREF